MIGVEFVPSEFESDVRLLEELKTFLSFDFILIPDNPILQVKPSSILSAKMLQDALDVSCVACVSGRGKSLEVANSLLLGAKYASLKGVACVSGDDGSLSSIDVLMEASNMEFEMLISSANELIDKIPLGLTHCITQPLYEDFPNSFEFPTLINFMPIFSTQTFEGLKALQFGIKIPQSYRQPQDLMSKNLEIYSSLKDRDFYLTPLNLKRQMPYLKSLFSHS